MFTVIITARQQAMKYSLVVLEISIWWVCMCLDTKSKIYKLLCIPIILEIIYPLEVEENGAHFLIFSVELLL